MTAVMLHRLLLHPSPCIRSRLSSAFGLRNRVFYAGRRGSISLLVGSARLYATKRGEASSRPAQRSQLSTPPPNVPEPTASKAKERRENIYTLPNALTLSRILACPVLGWTIVDGNFAAATTLLTYAGLTDLVDGYLARTYKMQSVLGTILDPAADKALMTTLTIALAMKGMLPVTLAIIILGRDVLLSISAFYYRYISLPPPKTFARYWDFSIPSAEVRPTQISKANTALQLLLMGSTTISPLLGVDVSTLLYALQWTVGFTTVWSGASYIFNRDAVRILSQTRNSNRNP